MECAHYFTKLWNERVNAAAGERSHFDDGAWRSDARTWTAMEFLGNLILLIVGGNDTTRNSITGGVLALNENPAEYDKLRDNPRSFRSWYRRSSAGRRRLPICGARRSRIPNSGQDDQEGRQGRDVVCLRQSRRGRDRERRRTSSSIAARAHHLSFGFGIHRCVGNCGWPKCSCASFGRKS